MTRGPLGPARLRRLHFVQASELGYSPNSDEPRYFVGSNPTRWCFQIKELRLKKIIGYQRIKENGEGGIRTHGPGLPRTTA